MAKPLRVLSIGFRFEADNVRNAPDLYTANALFDYDVVVIRPRPLFDENYVPGGASLSFAAGVRTRKALKDKNEDLQRLLVQGGLVVIILGPRDVHHFRSWSRTDREIHTVTNYDFLDDRLYLFVTNRDGERFSLTDPSEPFALVLKQSVVRWTAFITGRPEQPFNIPHIFATNGHDSFVGASYNFGGQVVFLPNFLRLEESAFLDACQEYRVRRAGTPAPPWTAKVYLPGEDAARMDIARIDAELEELARRRGSACRIHQELAAYKELLYERGKTRLEPVARRALDLLGFATTGDEILQHSDFEIDGRTAVGSISGILEVKGSRKQIDLDDFSPFPTKILHDLKQTGQHSKGILIGNGLCETPPGERLGEKAFSKHTLHAARTNSVALINSVELYWVVCGILAGEKKDLQAIHEFVLTSSGYVDLKTFCGASPFRA